MIGYMVSDVLAETERRVRKSGVETIEEVRSAGKALAGFSSELAAEERELKNFSITGSMTFLSCSPMRIEAERVVSNLAAAYRADPGLLPEHWQRETNEIDRLRTIGDFIAGMTDRFAIARHQELVGPVNLPADRF